MTSIHRIKNAAVRNIALGLVVFFGFSVGFSINVSAQSKFGAHSKKFKKAGPIKAQPAPVVPETSGSSSESLAHASGSSEINWNGQSRFEITLNSLIGQIVNYDSANTLEVGGAGAYLVKPKLQVGAEVSFLSMSGGGTSSSGFMLLGTGTYNLTKSDTIADSFFVKGGIGFGSQLFATRGTGKVEDATKLTFFFGVGKRFPFTQSLTLAPEIRYVKIDGVPNQIVIRPLVVTYLF